MALLSQFRRDTLENWQSNNPILADGEFALVANNPLQPKKYNYWVCGDGTTPFNNLLMSSLASSVGITGITSQRGNSESLAASQKLVEDAISESIGVYVNDPEYLRVYVDADGKFLWGIKDDGSIEWAKGVPKPVYDFVLAQREFTNEQVAALIDLISVNYLIDDPEGRLEICFDADNRIVSYRKANGIKVENAGIETKRLVLSEEGLQELANSLYDEGFGQFTNEQVALLLDLITTNYYIDDPEGRLEICLDANNRIVSYRKADGTKVEEVGIKAKRLVLSEEGLQELAAELKNEGFSGVMDWSNESFVQIPIPRTCAVINLMTISQAVTKNDNISTYIQYWDKDGNYFKKPIILNAQGQSSMSYHIKNQSIDLDDGSKIKFGNWLAFDSFHIKKDFIDVFRGQRVVAYHLAEQIAQLRPYGERRPWDYIDINSSDRNGLGTFSRDFNFGPLGHPDGFPIKVYFNGVNAGIYSLNIKKSRNNYNCDKNNQNQIILDGVLGDVFFTANGDLSQSGEVGSTIWEDFEIRNPKIATDINGDPYDGDNPKEPSNDYSVCKAAIERLTTAIPSINAESTLSNKQIKFSEFFNVPFLIDYDIIGNVIYHFDGYRKNWIWITNDGELWSPTIYDTDSIFGQYWDGTTYINGSTDDILGTSNNVPTGNNLLKALYQSTIELRYKYLKDAGIITVENIIKLLTDWLECIGYENLEEDIEKIVVSPYLENGNMVMDGEGNPVLVPNTPSYRDSTKTYVYPPNGGGFYNSIERVKNWLTLRLLRLDTYYNYYNY